MNPVYNVIFRPEPEGGFTAFVPSLPGCVTYGRDLKQARTMVEDAIDSYVRSLKKHGEEVPTDESVYVTTIHTHTENSQAKIYA
ncbi:type II toxin-antitoxin system HicB family antitoxin [Candidatus Uhrbacteria bacterium]|nr:type II toxin-antitoxin system HicB family antitoxin [Candidatus Uhrbacteria bacterium]